MKDTSIIDRNSVTLPFSIRAVCSRTRMPVRLRSVLFARFSASPTASCHPFGEDPIIVVTRATAIAHLLSRLCGSAGRSDGSRAAAGFGVVKNAAAGPPMGQSERKDGQGDRAARARPSRPAPVISRRLLDSPPAIPTEVTIAADRARGRARYQPRSNAPYGRGAAAGDAGDRVP